MPSTLRKKTPRWMWIVLGAVLAIGAGAAGYVGYRALASDDVNAIGNRGPSTSVPSSVTTTSPVTTTTSQTLVTSTSTAAMTTLASELPVVTISEDVPRLDLRGEDPAYACEHLGWVYDGIEQLEARRCRGEFPGVFGTEPFVVYHGFARDSAESAADVLASGDSFELRLDGQLVPPDGVADTMPGGEPTTAFYYVFEEGLSGTHTLTATWYVAGQLWTEVEHRVQFG